MNICFFGASSSRLDPVYTDAAYELGEKMAKRGHTLVYGAGCHGMMGAVARGVHDNGGRILGFSPEYFRDRKVLFDGCTELVFTPDMRDRKKAMEEHSDAVIMMPGSIGTYEEFFEMLTLKQIGQTAKAIVAFSVNNYFDELNAMLRRSVEENFLKPQCLDLFKTVSTADEALDYIEGYSATATESAWLH